MFIDFAVPGGDNSAAEPSTADVVAKSLDQLFAQNTAKATDASVASMAAANWRPENIKIVQNGPQGLKVPNVLLENADNLNFWQHVAGNQDYAKALYAKSLEADPKLTGPLKVNFRAKDGGMASGVINADGTSQLLISDKAGVDAAQQTVDRNGVSQELSRALQDLQATANSRVSALDAAQNKVNAAQATVVNAMLESAQGLMGLAGTSSQNFNSVADAIVAGGAAKAERAAANVAALQDQAGLDKVKAIWQNSLDTALNLQQKEKAARDKLDFVMSNPFHAAASYLAGGPDKNPVVIAAKETLRQVTSAREDAIKTADSVLIGMGRMQGVLNAEYAIATPAEIKAEAATQASKFRQSTIAEQAKILSLPTDIAKTSAEFAKAGFTMELQAATAELGAKTSTISALTGADKLVAQAEILALRERIAKMQDETKWGLAELKNLGQATPEANSDVAIRYAKLAGLPDGATFKEVTAAVSEAVRTKNPDLELAKVLGQSSTMPAVDKWRMLTALKDSKPLILKAYPEFATAITPGENSFSKWAEINRMHDTAVEIVRKAKQDKFSDKTDRPAAEAAAQKALVTSQAKPEEPVEAIVNGQKATIAAVSPWKINPGVYLMPGENQSGLSDATKAALADNKVAQQAAIEEAKYRLVPKRAGAIRTLTFDDLYAIAAGVKVQNPELSGRQVMSWIADIYKAGAELNNKYTAAKAFGLPEQKNYVINFEPIGFGKAALKVLGAASSETAAALLGTQTLGTVDPLKLGLNAPADSRAAYSALNLRDPFKAIADSEPTDVMNPVQLYNMAIKVDPKLWKDKN